LQIYISQDPLFLLYKLFKGERLDLHDVYKKFLFHTDATEMIGFRWQIIKKTKRRKCLIYWLPFL